MSIQSPPENIVPAENDGFDFAKKEQQANVDPFGNAIDEYLAADASGLLSRAETATIGDELVNEMSKARRKAIDTTVEGASATPTVPVNVLLKGVPKQFTKPRIETDPRD